MKTNYSHPEGMTYSRQEILSDTAQCLTSGGDARIALDAISGMNQYGCRPFPDPAMLAYGSSTASIISTQGYHHANQLHQRLVAALKTEAAATIYSHEIKRLREQLIHLCVVPETTGMIFSASGTDTHRLVASYAARGNKLAPPRIIMIEANETGKGVNAALKTATHDEQSEVIPIKLRLDNGELRPITAIDEEVEALVTEAITTNRRVLLIVTDQSKTGLIAPSLSYVLGLHQRFQDKMDVLIDACQFRIAPPTLRAYLELGFIVALTGSKFLTGPSFSGVILFKSSLSSELEAAYSTLPPHSEPVNFGLLLRWKVALQELKAFRSIPQEYIINFIHDFTAAIHERLQQDAFFERLPVPTIDRSPLQVDSSWDQLQTIFPFLLYHADTDRAPLSAEETLRVYQQLPISINDKHDNIPTHYATIANLRCQTGQPVACGQRNGVAISALRLCISTRLIVESSSEESSCQLIINAALSVLDKITLLIRLLPVE